jgi:O-antigen ligase
MYLPHVAIMAVALSIILLWCWARYQQIRSNTVQVHAPVLILAFWLVACAVFGPAFLVVRFPGVFDLTVERLLFMVLLFFLVAGYFTGKVRLNTNMSIEINMLVLTLICVFSMLRTGFYPLTTEFPSPWFVFITGYLFPFIVFVFAKNYIRNENEVQLILQALFCFGTYLSLIAFFEFFNFRQFVFPQYINNPEIQLHLDRARGPLMNAAFNGVGILVGFICGVHLLEKKKGFIRVFYQSALILFFPAIFFTQTRSVYLGMLIVMVLFWGWYETSFPKWKLASLPLAVVLILVMAYSPQLLSKERREGGIYQTEEVDIRMTLIQKSVFLLSEHPFTGVGLAQFIPASVKEYKGHVPFIAENANAEYQHNHLLGLAVELGTGGLIVYLSIIFLILKRLWQLSGKLQRTGIMGINLRLVILSVWCVYLSNNMFVEPSYAIFINAVPFVFAGMADGLYTRSLQSGLNLCHQ